GPSRGAGVALDSSPAEPPRTARVVGDRRGGAVPAGSWRPTAPPTASGESVDFPCLLPWHLGCTRHGSRLDWPQRVLIDGGKTWRGRDILSERRFEIHALGGPFVGRVSGVRRHGRLLVRDTVGERRPVTAEEIRPCH